MIPIRILFLIKLEKSRKHMGKRWRERAGTIIWQESTFRLLKHILYIPEITTLLLLERERELVTCLLANLPRQPTRESGGEPGPEYK